MSLNTAPYRMTIDHNGAWLIVTHDAESREVARAATYAEAARMLRALNGDE